MNICVINGSPRGERSVTLQTVLYLEKLNPAHEFRYINAGVKIKVYERDMTEAKDALEWADMILFSYPVYTFLAPSQLHRFIELVKGLNLDMSGKFATQITTSKHFYDVTAHKYIEENCRDLGLKYVLGLSADMEDLLTEKGRREAELFFAYLCRCVEDDVYETGAAQVQALAGDAFVMDEEHFNAAYESDTYDTVIVADLAEDDVKLRAMIDAFRERFPYHTRLVNIREYPFAGGCLGCLRCAVSGACVYKDGFDLFLREKIESADCTVYAFTISDHSMGARFKMFDDRRFCNGHRTTTEGHPVGYIINGKLECEANLKTVIEARASVGNNFLAGEAVDGASMSAMIKRLTYALENGYNQPRNFWGVGGMKIFRDLIWGMRGIMTADHRFYKEKGMYDFPQKKRGNMIKMVILGKLLRSPLVKGKAGKLMDKGMVAPYKKVIEQAVKEK